MITAVDTSVLIDVLAPDPRYGPSSATALRHAIGEGRLIACEVVWTEVGARFDTIERAVVALDRLGVGFSPMGREDALAAGRAWRAYRERGGRRDRVVADFLITAHACAWADRLLTRDRGLSRHAGDDLVIVDPSPA